jgi:polyhydroxybutyrate depolymerase
MRLWLSLFPGALLVAACGSHASTDANPDASAGHGAGSGSGGAGSGSGSGGAGSGSGSGGAGSGSGSGGAGSGSGAGNADDASEGSSDSASADGSPSASADASTCTGTPTSTASVSGYAGDWVPGDYPSNFSSGNYLTISGVAGQMGNTRQYAVHVPTGYRSDTPVPALFCLHGLDQNPVMFCLDTGVAWPTKADQEGFVVIMPNGYMNSWNGGTCCGAAASSGLDDVALMRAIFAEVGTHVNIDLGRVYATGLSNGAYLSYRLACEASDLFVAVAPSAGAIGTAAIGGGTMTTSDLMACTPTHKISVLDVHGTSDPLIAYSLQAPTLAIMQASDGCGATTMPATAAPSGGDTTCVSFAGCPACPNVNVTGCSIMGGGHCWFGSSDCGTGGGAIGNAVVGNNSNFMKNTDTIWAFFSGISR